VFAVRVLRTSLFVINVIINIIVVLVIFVQKYCPELQAKQSRRCARVWSAYSIPELQGGGGAAIKSLPLGRKHALN